MNRFLSSALALGLLCVSSLSAGQLIVTTPDAVSVTSEGLFVNANDELIPVESIELANDGFLVAIPKINADICPNCHHEGHIPGRFCCMCDFPDDG